MMSAKRPPARNVVTARRGPSLNVILIVVVVVLAVGVIGGILLFNRSSSSGDASTDSLVPAGANTLSVAQGDAAGKVTLVEFLDYQCPACHSYYVNVTKQLQQDYQGRITFVTRNFPLDMHPLAIPAARAAEAAARQGKYEQMYHALFDNYEQWAYTGQNINSDEAAATAFFESQATAIGLDLDRFRTDVASSEVQAIIDRDVAQGKSLGITSTPTFFINGEKFQATGSTADQVSQSFHTKIDGLLGG